MLERSGALGDSKAFEIARISLRWTSSEVLQLAPMLLLIQGDLQWCKNARGGDA